MSHCENVAAEPLRLIAGCDAIRLVCDFDKRGDRFGHRIGLLDGHDRCTYLWDSVDEGVDVNWPASPPIQDLSIEEIDGCPTALAVGMAGRSHWSTSIQAVASDTGAIEFDYACKVPAGPAKLHSTYRRLVDAKSLPVGVATCEAGAVRLTISKGATLLKNEPDQECLEVEDPGDVDRMRTIVWTYRFTLA